MPSKSRGRPDLAVQVWQQILLSDPKNADALAGLARDYKLTGIRQGRSTRLTVCAASILTTPTSPESKPSPAPGSERAELRQAGELGRQGKVDDAMRIYRQLYGDHPPDGDIALAYYQTLYGTANGKAGSDRRHARPGRPQPRRSALRHRAGHHAHLRPQDPRRRHSHPPRTPQRPERPGRASPGADLGLGQSRLGCRAARLPQRASPGHRDLQRSQGRRVQAGADELRHRAHARRARRLCRAQRAPPRRGRDPLHGPPRRRAEQRPRRRRHGLPAHAAEELRRRHQLSHPGREERLQGTHRRRRARHFALLVHHGRGFAGLRRESTSTSPAPSTAPLSP